MCVFPAGFTGRDGEPLPLIVRKSDGGFGYAATDLAALRYRVQRAGRHPAAVRRRPRRSGSTSRWCTQSAREAGWLARRRGAEHVGFGSILGTDGKMLAHPGRRVGQAGRPARRGGRPGRAIVAEKNPDLDAATRPTVAAAVGHRRDQVRRPVHRPDQGLRLRLGPDAGPRRQHRAVPAVRARPDPVRSSGAAAVDRRRPDRPSCVAEPAERALALELLGFARGGRARWPRTLRVPPARRLPVRGWRAAFTAFYERCPVLRAEGEVRESRLALCDLTARILGRGLALLGIRAPDRM